MNYLRPQKKWGELLFQNKCRDFDEALQEIELKVLYQLNSVVFSQIGQVMDPGWDRICPLLDFFLQNCSMNLKMVYFLVIYMNVC